MTQPYFSDDEWSLQMQSPLQALRAVALADKTSPVSCLKEAHAGLAIVAADLQPEEINND